MLTIWEGGLLWRSFVYAFFRWNDTLSRRMCEELNRRDRWLMRLIQSKLQNRPRQLLDTVGNGIFVLHHNSFRKFYRYFTLSAYLMRRSSHWDYLNFILFWVNMAVWEFIIRGAQHWSRESYLLFFLWGSLWANFSLFYVLPVLSYNGIVEDELTINVFNFF